MRNIDVFNDKLGRAFRMNMPSGEIMVFENIRGKLDYIQRRIHIEMDKQIDKLFGIKARA